MNYFFLLDMSVETCSNIMPALKVLAIIIAAVEFLLGIVLPFALILIGIISLIRAIASKKEIKKRIKKLFKNIILAVLIFLTIITINTMSSVVTCDIYREDGIDYEESGCCLDRAKSQISKEEVSMVTFLLTVFIISFVFKKKSRKTVEKPTNI